MESSSPTSSSPTSSPPDDGLTTNTSTAEAQQEPPRPLSAIAQQAYDRYGVIDHARLDLMIRGFFISCEDAALLPHRITPDGCPDVRIGVSHHQRPSMCGGISSSSITGVGGVSSNAVGPPGGAAATALATAAAARAAAKPRAPSSVRASSSARATGVSALPSSHEKWTEGEVRLLIGLRAENVGFRFIADRFPGKNQKAVQEKFYKSIKDTRDPRWKQLYDDLCAQHGGAGGTAEYPIEIADEEAAVAQAVDNSSETLSETTVADRDAERIEVCEDAVEDMQTTF